MGKKKDKNKISKQEKEIDFLVEPDEDSNSKNKKSSKTFCDAHCGSPHGCPSKCHIA